MMVGLISVFQAFGGTNSFDSLSSTTIIEPNQWFVLGEGEHGGYKAKSVNKGIVDIEVFTESAKEANDKLIAGTEIISINGESGRNILEKQLPLMFANGQNTSFKYAKLDGYYQFHYLYELINPGVERFVIELRFSERLREFSRRNFHSDQTKRHQTLRFFRQTLRFAERTDFFRRDAVCGKRLFAPSRAESLYQIYRRRTGRRLKRRRGQCRQCGGGRFAEQ